MFGRSSIPETKPVEPAKPASTAFPSPPANATVAASGAASSSTLGSDIAIIGQQVLIVSQNRLVIDGQVRGDIKGHEVVIGENGRVSGTIIAQSVEVRGTVTGAIKGSNVTLTPTARVDGDITKMSLVISEGAHLDGSVRRAKDQGEVTPNLKVPD